MDALTLDQFAVFVCIVEEGSFAAAARRLGRAQSAVTYAVQKLEEQSQVTLFDRSAYRPRLTEAGRSLLPRARRIIDGVEDYRQQASGIAKGLEAELTLALDSFVPFAMIADTLKAFHEALPLVQLRLSVEWHDAAVQAVSEARADLAVLMEFGPPPPDITRYAFGAFDLVPVAAPTHALAALQGPIDTSLLWDELQLVVSNRLKLTDQRDFGVLAANCWHVTDHHTKHALLLAGVGWGSMPRPSVEADLVAGRLVELHPTSWEGADHMPRLSVVVAHHAGKALGPAGRWLAERLRLAGSGERTRL